MVWKMVWEMVRKIIRMVWLCEFRGGINGWDLKILYRDLKSWKKWLKKKWNGMEWFGGLEKLKKNKKIE